ncbi:HNH endonuclease [Butyrivibrio fibrisolvens]|uniref:HNH endonuclease n=1 Tax=Butyrivibrio fibrisolvens TaxID=831 RepID=UPI0003B764F2|nr:HNH endonuclease [Butyrivibrio fibrisolvens]
MAIESKRSEPVEQRLSESQEKKFDPDKRIEKVYDDGQHIVPESYDVDKRIAKNEVADEGIEQVNTDLEDVFDPDKRIEDIPSENETIDGQEFQQEEISAEVKESMDAVKRWKEEHPKGELPGDDSVREFQAKRGRGEWTGTPGNSTFIPESAEAKEALKEYGMDGVVYKNNIPYFSGCTKETVSIDNMSQYRLEKGGNYEQAFIKLAEKFNAEAKGGITSWDARMARKWVNANGLTPHECSDMETIQFVNTDIHKACKHCGGVYEAMQCVGGNEFDE